ncbi:hypothetical protein [Herbaspirillum sp. YR522]|uniref:hypothetical protein n=1 Tax=Herbaspirillum sp. YR522 TaxID=1144342 RepID=UPI00026FAB38|nr:hypothetical protein [Herbaspirillum sp. YR522]EJN00476.1 hypothetical protein PMI40_03545 [Herbaspirillum sp. YR522]
MSTSQLHEQIRAALFQLREVNPTSHVHLLLDGNHPCHVDDALHPSQLARREIACTPVTIKRADFAHDPQICPSLVTLFSPGDRGYPDELLLDQSIAYAQAHHASVNGTDVCGWLLSERCAEELAPHLAHACELFDLTLGKRRVLPLFEPHRLALAADAGKDGFMRRWLGPVSHWLWVDLNGALRSVTAHDLAEDGQGRQHLDENDWKAQRRVDEAKVVLLALADAQRMVPVKPEIAIDRALQRAIDEGLQRTEDLVFFALNDFSIGSGWAGHPAALRAIAQAQAGPQTLSELISALNDATLDEIAAYRVDAS